MPTTFDVSDLGRLKLKLRPGEYVQVGEARVTFLEQEGESLYVVFEAPRSMPIGRAGRLSQTERRAILARQSGSV